MQEFHKVSKMQGTTETFKSKIHIIDQDVRKGLLDISAYRCVEFPPCCVMFQIPTADSIKMTAFWDIAPCSLSDADQCFCPSPGQLMREAIPTSDTWAYFNKITRPRVSEQYFLLNHGKERNMIIGSLDLKSIK
jgi:hypothetical protein